MLGAAFGRKKLLTILALLFEFYMFKGSREPRPPHGGRVFRKFRLRAVFPPILLNYKG